MERASAKTFSPGRTRLRVYTQKIPIARCCVSCSSRTAEGDKPMSAMNNKKGRAAMK